MIYPDNSLPIRSRRLEVTEPRNSGWLLLCARDERPRRRAAEPRDERTPVHSMTSSPRVPGLPIHR